MRKEIVLAIVLGITLGLVIIFGINLANQSANKNLPNPLPTPTISDTPKENPETKLLQITSPANNSVSFKDSVTLTGKTKGNAWLGIIWEDGQSIIQADQFGNFKQEISLIGGENAINITASSKEGYQESQKIIVIYTTAKIK